MTDNTENINLTRFLGKLKREKELPLLMNVQFSFVINDHQNTTNQGSLD